MLHLPNVALDGPGEAVGMGSVLEETEDIGMVEEVVREEEREEDSEEVMGRTEELG